MLLRRFVRISSRVSRVFIISIGLTFILSAHRMIGTGLFMLALVSDNIAEWPYLGWFQTEKEYPRFWAKSAIWRTRVIIGWWWTYSHSVLNPTVNAPTLARIFNDVTNSYKFLFFLALLDMPNAINLLTHAFLFSLNDIVLDMLVQPWYPHVYFKLSFGKSDRIARELDKAVQYGFFF